MKWTHIRIRKETYERLWRLRQELTESHLRELGRTLYFWEILEALMDAWDLTDEETRAEILNTIIKRELGKAVGVH